MMGLKHLSNICSVCSACKKLSACGKKARLDQAHTHTSGGFSFARRNHEFFEANREIERHKLELGGPEGNVEHDVVAEIARNVLNKLIGDEEPHCFGAGVTKSQVSKFSCDLRKMRGEVITNENHFLLEKVQIQKKQLETQKNQLETQKKQLENQNKEIETHKKQLDVQSLQLEDMGQKLNELYGILKVVETAFPGLYNGASTSGATGTCDKQPSFGASPLPDHYPGGS